MIQRHHAALTYWLAMAGALTLFLAVPMALARLLATIMQGATP